MKILKITECDIFIYQPIDIKHQILNTYNNNGILQFLKPSCIKLCFPCIYADI